MWRKSSDIYKALHLEDKCIKNGEGNMKLSCFFDEKGNKKKTVINKCFSLDIINGFAGLIWPGVFF